jgi:trigger factor
MTTETQESTQEFMNDLISLKVNHQPGCHVIFEAKLSPKATEEAWKNSLKAINKEAQIPGFRKGKAPLERIEREFLSSVQKEWNDQMVQIAFQNSLALSKIYPLNRESLKQPKIKNAVRGEGAHVTLEFTAFPAIPVVDPLKLELRPVAPKAIEQKDVEDTIESLRYSKAKWIPVDKKGIEDGDFVRLDIVNTDLPHRPFICQDTPFEMKEGKIGTWLYKALLGKAIHDVVSALSEKEEADDKEFKPTNCEITIKACEKPELPLLDDQFASLFGCKTCEELQKRVEEDLKRQAKEIAFEEEKKQAVTALCETYPFEIPEPLFQQEKKGRLEEIKAHLNRLSQEEKAHFESTFSDEEFSKGIKNSLRMLFFVRALAERFQIKVLPNEWMEELSRLYSRRDPIVDDLFRNYNKEQMQEELNSRVLRRKVLEEVVRQALPLI